MSRGLASRLILLTHSFAYTKARFDNPSTAFLKQLKEAIGDG